MSLKIKATVAAIALTLFTGVASAEPSGGGFTPEQEARIGKIAADYMLAHPEILVQVSQKLQARQEEQQMSAMTSKVIANQKALLNDAASPVVGPKDAKVAVIEFFDYQCVYCSKLAPELEAVMKSSPNVRFVFKEWPIFADRWQESHDAAATGLAVLKAGGPDAYLKFHNGIYSTGHFEGALTAEDIQKAVKGAIGDKMLEVESDGIKDQLNKVGKLAQALGLTGTPGLIVMPISNATPEKVTILPGAVPFQRITAAIEKAAK